MIAGLSPRGEDFLERGAPVSRTHALLLAQQSVAKLGTEGETLVGVTQEVEQLLLDHVRDQLAQVPRG